MFVLFLFGLVFGGSVVETQHYAACKADNFSGQTCAVEKVLCLKNNDSSVCK